MAPIKLGGGRAGVNMRGRGGKVKTQGNRALPVRVKRVANQAELARAFAIRIRVFVKEQGVPREIELDADDPKAIHLLAKSGSRAVGTARVVTHGGAAKIGRMAVVKSYRRKGVGTKLLRRAVAIAQGLQARRIYLHAQVTALEFYAAMHFRAVGAVFDEAGIAHRKMIWRPPSRAALGQRRKR